MQVNLLIILIFHFWKQIREGEKSLYKHLPVSSLEAEPSSGLAYTSVNENPIQKLCQHQKQSHLESFLLTGPQILRNQAEKQHSKAELDTQELLSLHDEGGSVPKTKHTHTPIGRNNTKHSPGLSKTKKPTTPCTNQSMASPSHDNMGDTSADGLKTTNS